MTIDIVLILTPNLVCTYILCIYNNMQQIQVDRNDAEDLLENEDDNFLENLNNLENFELTGLYFVLLFIESVNLIHYHTLFVFLDKEQERIGW